MTDAAITITLLLTVTFAFGMAIGSQIERSRRRRREAQREIDWMREVGDYPNLEKFVTEHADEIAERRLSHSRRRATWGR